MENDTTKRLYEVGYLIIPLIPEDKVADEVNVLRSHIEGAGGVIVADVAPAMRKLAYEIKQRGVASKRLRFDDAYFGSLRFNSSAEQVLAINESFDKNDKVLRYIIIKPINDTPRVIRTGVPSKAKGETVGKEAKPAMSDQDLDKEIDQLLVGDKVAA